MLDKENHKQLQPDEEEDEKSQSLLFRLWSKTKGKKEKPSDSSPQEDSEPENAAAEPQPPLEQEPAPRPEPDRDDFVSKLRSIWLGFDPEKTENEPAPEDLAGMTVDPTWPEDRIKFDGDIQRQAEAIWTTYTARRDSEKRAREIAAAVAAQEEAGGGADPDGDQAKFTDDALQEFTPSPPDPVDAQIIVRVSDDKLRAWLFIFPPQNGGKEAGWDAISAAIKEAGVSYGMDEGLQELAQKQDLYLHVVTAARGTPARDGQDGYIEDVIPRVTELELKEKENGLIDYKNLNLVREVKKGDVICNIIPPTEPENGMNIKGNPIWGHPGKAATPPKGNNTEVNEDGTALVASIDGSITFDNNKFKVEKILMVDGDVDNSIGNLDFQGDIVISGDVRDGFTVKAKGDVTVKGMVEGAEIFAQGNINIAKGMNGNSRGILEARGEIKSKFLENCTVRAAGTIFAESVICSNIYCDDKVMVLTNKGVIIGGTFTVAKSIEAKVIGSKSNRITNLVLGNTPNMLKHKQDIEGKLKAVRATLEDMSMNISYLERSAQSPDRKAMLNQLKLKKPLQLMQESKLVKELEKLNEQMSDLASCRVKCSTIFPPTKITIGTATVSLQDVKLKCNVYYSEGEIVFGTL